ncbi:hypothetical protein FDZ73_24645 [bacterium]|nr:MAG: hypothetical protein FDZ73_24645 [bacterium]
MIFARITVGTCYGDADIPVEVLGKGPRPGTAWVKALDGLQPFTKMSHGGPYQDNTAVVLILHLRDVHLESELAEEQVEEIIEKPAVRVPILAPDWFLESTYEDRTCLE